MGIDFDFNDFCVSNAIECHALLDYAGEVNNGNQQHAVAEAIFHVRAIYQ